ncbi:hypothetical protein D3C73_1658090 [compost metagenome]
MIGLIDGRSLLYCHQTFAFRLVGKTIGVELALQILKAGCKQATVEGITRGQPE